MPEFPAIDTALDAAGTDAYLVVADGDDSDQYYLSGFRMMAAHPTMYADTTVRTCVPDLEYSRAVEESDADEIRRYSYFDFGEKLVDQGRARARALVTAEFLVEYGIERVSVPPTFPNGTADVLRERGIDVVTDFDEVLLDVRAVKTDAEVDHVRTTQRANEVAMAVAEDLLADATITGDELRLDGELVTSERIRRAITVELLDRGCGLDECIVAAGPDAAKAHAVGSGPIRPNEPVIVDIFPRHEETRYFADMTRTFVKGEPSDQVREWYDLTREAFDAALDVLEPGVTGEAVNEAVCDVFEDAGYPTLRTDEATENGFTSSTGHGVGLDVHERPVLSWGGGELEPGHVVTVEPGLYEPGVGGVRLEDLIVVTEDGFDNLTDYPRDLRVV